ncbi:MAG: nuclease-related domain-containing protein [Aliarcobacter sp.]|jgi:thiamine phosphate synthase YjbQ (UPF0047 family)|nr:nuclease-related domain-containing protein [Aliarcobacter sp.]
MILKNIDEHKEKQITILKNLLNLSQNENQKILIKKELSKLETGLKGEKDTAYFIDFKLNDNENYVVLHDLRFETEKFSAQIDHLLINKALGIILVETKHTKAKVTINDDGTMLYDYGKGKSYNQANPLEQSKRHEQILHEILEKYNMKMHIESYVVFLPDVVITNKELPKHFHRADSFYDSIVSNFQRSPIKILGAISKLITNKIPTTREMENIGNILIKEHKPVNIDYEKKYPISNSKNNLENEKITTIQNEELNDIEILCKKNNIDISTFKEIKHTDKYMGKPMVSFICKKCETTQKKGFKTFTETKVLCKVCEC